MTELRKQLLGGAIGLVCGVVPMLWVRSNDLDKVAADRLDANKERLTRLELVTDQAANGLKSLIEQVRLTTTTQVNAQELLAVQVQVNTEQNAQIATLIQQVRETGLQVARLAALIEKGH